MSTESKEKTIYKFHAKAFTKIAILIKKIGHQVKSQKLDVLESRFQKQAKVVLRKRASIIGDYYEGKRRNLVGESFSPLEKNLKFREKRIR